MNSILEKAKDLIKMIIAITCALRIKFSKSPERKVVINYHDIPKSSIRSFRKQVEYLVKNYNVVKPTEILGTGNDGFGPVVAITIDDSYQNVFENALPILREYHVSAGIFVPAGNLGEKPKWDFRDDCEDMHQEITNPNQVIKMHQDGFEVCSHSYSHPRLSTITKEKLHYELAGSKKILEELIGHEVTAVSYPYGDYDEKVCHAAEMAGYSHGFTIEPITVSDSTDNLKIGRCEVSPSDSLFKFKLKCYGAFQGTFELCKLKQMLLRCLHR